MSEHLSRRDALRLGALAATVPAAASVGPARADAAAPTGDAGTGADPGPLPRPGWVADNWVVKPFALNQVALRDGIFQQKRDRMLNYARNYPGTGGVLDGPDRMLHLFRANAGLPAPGTWPGGWDTPNHLLRGHFTGHYLTMLAQCYADTGEEIFREKLDYLVTELGRCQRELDRRNFGRVAGRAGRAVRLGDPHPNQYVLMPAGILDGVTELTVATWVNLAAAQTAARIFSFGAGPQSYLSLTARIAAGAGPRFAITTGGSAGEQRVDATVPVPVGEWAHLAVTLSAADATARIYLDGAEVGAGAVTLGPANLGRTTDNWIGRSPANNDPLLTATVDDLRIYDRALGPDEIRALAAPDGTAGTSTAATPLAWYRFEEEGETAADHSGNGHAATIVGTAHPGFLAAFPEGQFSRLEPPTFQPNSGPNAVWAVWYTCHKIMRGLLNAYQLVGNEEALAIVFRMGDWAHSRLSRISRADLDRMWDIYSAGEAGSMNEVMAELSALAPDRERRARYLDTAKAFTFSTLFAASLAQRDELAGRHANQYMAPNIGYLRIFERTGERDYHRAARNFWSMVVPHRIFSNGGAGQSEHFRARGIITSGFTSGSDPRHAETCCAYNMLRLTRNLFFHDPDPAYLDYYEKALHNQILSSRRDVDSVTSTEVTYHQNMWPGRSRRIGNVVEYSRYGGNGSCCNGTGLESHTKYQETIYFRSADDSALYVNLFIASVLTWPERGFVISQETAYPTEGASTLRFDRGHGRLRVKLRVPSWAGADYTVRVNGRQQHVKAVPGSYLTLDRWWREGDRIDISMPLRFRVEKALDDRSVQSIMYGPTLMVVRDATPSYREFTFFPTLGLDGDLGRAIQPTGTPMHFSTHGYLLAPYYVSDPVPGEFNAYHPYVRRVEPEVVFGSVRTGVPNDGLRDADGETFLDRVWAAAPFRRHGDFLRTVRDVSDEWLAAGRHTAAQRRAILVAAVRARRDLAH
ncbi:glycosylase [Plantactinospora sp. BC1]|uniref:beta-L-arabinofuranosidase domain-containing protein n=1 Tax=Plantactinospora sp. BC1 TaxID=2108470 RepID=UPI000D15CBD0|nr:beta-L-arabinofuranosidase domain-containing protein [Plantactinospora sp. BC1]AVT29555.1 glycosylase [Plantactinospora sp. BC1]